MTLQVVGLILDDTPSSPNPIRGNSDGATRLPPTNACIDTTQTTHRPHSSVFNMHGTNESVRPGSQRQHWSMQEVSPNPFYQESEIIEGSSGKRRRQSGEEHDVLTQREVKVMRLQQYSPRLSPQHPLPIQHTETLMLPPLQNPLPWVSPTTVSQPAGRSVRSGTE